MGDEWLGISYCSNVVVIGSSDWPCSYKSFEQTKRKSVKNFLFLFDIFGFCVYFFTFIIYLFGSHRFLGQLVAILD